MAQTDPVWDWRVELREEEASELEVLRATVAELHAQLEQAAESLTTSRQRESDARQALSELDAAKLWNRRRVRARLRERQQL